MIENWNNIIGYNYSISDMGNVRNNKTNRILKTMLNNNGYLRIKIKNNYFFIHKLVAKYFISNPENKLFVNHKNCIKTDNRFDNLEWCTRSENMQHAIKNGHGGIKFSMNNLPPQTKLTPNQVREIRDLYGSIDENELALKYNISKKYMREILQFKYWKNI